ncbi:hypothetical protein [Larkinella sp. C7]|jgi:hypothetical protein|uniref:hypothetical protein n=1 Tax=Larkinella sp. C7 TaxID=2576607 RepID=UPI00111100D7|nr:hypothetical protein [Larkinella sp. C7]
MPKSLRFILPLWFVLLLGACSVQDHVIPSSDSCQVTEFLDGLDYYKLAPGETVTIGQVVTGRLYTWPVLGIIKIGDDSYAVGGPDAITTYEYDSQGRVKRTVNQTPRAFSGATFYNEYSYEPGKIIVTTIQDLPVRPKPDTLVRTLQLTSDGLVIDPKVTYENGFVVERRYDAYSQTYTVSNGNVIKFVEGPYYAGSSYLVYDYKFDITKANPIPAIYPFNGKSDANLLTEYQSKDQNGDTADVKVHYLHEAEGRVYKVDYVKRPQQPDLLLIDRYTLNCPTY